MIVVDSSVWVDYFNGRATAQTDRLHALLDTEPLAVGDLIVTEVLQGFRHDRDFETARGALLSLTVFEMLGVDAAIRSAALYRRLRSRGVTIRKTADVIIASFCLANGHALLFSDRDFEPVVEHAGLLAVR